MADAQDRVSIELIDAGDHKDHIAQILSKVKGLAASPQQIVMSAPTTIAANVPRNVAEKLKGYLEQAGAMIMLEGEDDLFSPDDVALNTPPAEEEPLEPVAEFEAEDDFGEEPAFELDDAPDDDLPEFTADDLPGPADDLSDELFGAPASPGDETFPSSLPETADIGDEEDMEFEPEDEEKPGKFQRIAGVFSRFGKKKRKGDEGDEGMDEEDEEAPKQGGRLAFLSKLRKPKAIDEDMPEADFDEDEPSEKRILPDLFSNPVVIGIIGFLAGAILAGMWGSISNKSLEREWQQRLLDYETQTAQEIEQESAGLKEQVAQLTQKLEAAAQKNTELTAQVDELNTQLENAPQMGSGPTWTLDGDVSEHALIAAFEEVKARHAQSLEQGAAAQEQAPCTQQVLLDGTGRTAYAQVVKKFSAKYTKMDIMRSNSLLTPYKAEFKIPFQQEIRSGDTLEACEAQTLQELPSPSHHEFGGYYGYWTIQYTYENGQWVVDPTVIEKNRALYESAFQHGSPDYAKFRIDTELFPEFKSQPE